MTKTPTRSNVVSQAYARDGKGPMVYGRYKEAGYKVEPLVDKLGTRITENVSGTEAFRIAGLDWTAEKREAFFMGADGPVLAPDHCSVVRSDTHEPRLVDVDVSVHGEVPSTDGRLDRHTAP